METYKIFPTIGISRVGSSKTDFFLSPEKTDSKGIEIDSGGNEIELSEYKDTNGLIKRQGCRFRVFKFDEDTKEYKPIEENLQEQVVWSVNLVNKKSAVVRPFSNMRPPNSPPSPPLQVKQNSAEFEINGGINEISGKNTNPKEFAGRYKDTSVILGDIRTDKNGNLIVLGGYGISGSPSGSPVGPQPDPQTGERVKTSSNNFYYNEDWYDDTSDGFVKAKINIDGEEIEIDGAWIIVAPPDYAPLVKGVVTLYDVIQQTNSEDLDVPNTYFNRDIKPMIDRFSSHKWVHKADYDIDISLDQMIDSSVNGRQYRIEVVRKIRKIENYLSQYKLTDIQKAHLRNYASGNFKLNINENSSSGNFLTKLSLDSTIGQGFFPGIEGGIILKNPDIYKSEFTINHDKVNSGEITGLMALPWQADFLECQGRWWPSQRPDLITMKNGQKRAWARTNQGPLDPLSDHKILVNEFDKFGFINEVDGNQIETERDPNF
ncbi:LodA/GoxA family CTQ-dependent oxidase [Aquimarina sp. 2201CG5-10]|uniref:LodA/GoxA family CTQ-dependent oxidase n=1 Tax=Aquimarina callyspongiae TaxID=3098150 RepID=UPI002AB52709|nr:LodA/GoxA family CTQ-dependent oxidase [Aquimarina sp. 2201CG5-10]MDY8136907.1 LodA/GoxA family CTQ-dependent oxidase [Aquimarina sp. 2201CG5-10]